MYSRILVPLDGSKRSEAILPHVEELAMNLNSEVFFLRILEAQYKPQDAYVTQLNETNDGSSEIRLNNARNYLNGIMGVFREKKIKAQIYIEKGDIVQSIMKFANQEEISLIALASHGRTGMSRVFYGSVAASLIQLVDRPLLIVRARGNN